MKNTIKNEDILDILERKFSKIKKIENFFKSNNDISLQNKEDKKKEENNINIYVKYLQNPTIIFQKNDFNNTNLILLFTELKIDLENGNNIILPFLIDIVPNLVQAYIESDLDDSIYIKDKKISLDESIYLKIFEKLKENCFISKEILFPVYDYFKNLYDINVDSKNFTIENNCILKKFNKVIKLFEIFYNNKVNKTCCSSFCFIGGSANIDFNNEFCLSHIYTIDIELNILNCDYINYLNDDLYLIKINNEGIKYKDLKKNLNNKQKLRIIHISINSTSININFVLDKNNFSIKENLKCESIRNILLLENFYGQISSFKLAIREKKNKKEYLFLPISIRKKNKIFYKKLNNINNTDIIDDIIPIIIIDDKHLVNINYINYNDENFNIMNYFGGIIQFLPFYQILKKLIVISNDSNNKYPELKNQINYFFNCIIKLIIKQLFLIKKKKKIIEKNICFVYYLCLDLDLELSIILDKIVQKKNGNDLDVYNKIDLLIMLYYNQKNLFDNFKKKTSDIIKNMNLGLDINLSFFEKPKKSLNQLYTKYMKNLFCFNNLWSKRNIFFPKRYNNFNNEIIKIKYKQLNYYTKNFQFPYFYPILEYGKYYPKFASFKGNLYKDNESKILEYDFELKTNEKAKKIIEVLITEYNKSISFISEKCCLVKNTHHVVGKLSLYQKKYSKSKNFTLIFRIIAKEKKDEYHNCNNEFFDKNEISNKEEAANQDKNKNNNMFNSNPNNLCYGEVFLCPEKEFKRNIIIKSKNILFVLLRIYFKRLSAIEIFTVNKSYIFNFQNPFEIKHLKANKIISIFINNSSFKEINLKDDKLMLGYYNVKYRPYLFPLFEDEINFWDKKVKYFCKYDILSLVNLFSNRSFRDVFQYPIFPVLYNLIGLERDMSQHIGFQEISKVSVERKKFFIKNYNDEVDEAEKYLFNIHYSNPAFVFNYLIRVFPYTFLAIEFQGDGFDMSNRIFFSIESTLKSSINISSDLREMIPELYYMIELFYNKNEILFGELYDGRKIDDVIVKEKDNKESKKLEIYAQFLYNMRNNLENNKNINKWIDLIFGINQKYYISDEGYKYSYYENSSEISFQSNNAQNPYCQLEIDKISFGLIPYQLFNRNFPTIPEKNNQILNELKILNEELFIDEHIKINNPRQTFLCKGRTFVDENYIKIIEPNEKLNILGYYFNKPNYISKIKDLSFLNNKIFEMNFGFLMVEMDISSHTTYKYEDKMSLVNYYFLGDIYGMVKIYALKELKKNENEKEEKLNEESKYNFSMKLKNIDSKSTDINPIVPIMILNHHIKEIKYIDFNQRLNSLLSYSLDNFINIYIFPKFKLINAIDANSFKDANDKNYFDEVVFISFPFPSIICHNNEFIYMLSINGELIKYDKLKEGDKVIFSIDKNLGTIKDKIEIYNSKGNLLSLFNFF